MTISGRTVQTQGGWAGKGIGQGRDATNSGSCTITGGSVKADSFGAQPSNGATDVYCVTVTVPQASTNATLTGPGDYGTKDLFSDATSKVYRWLPNGAHAFVAGGALYAATVADDAATVAETALRITGYDPAEGASPAGRRPVSRRTPRRRSEKRICRTKRTGSRSRPR